MKIGGRRKGLSRLRFGLGLIAAAAVSAAVAVEAVLHQEAAGARRDLPAALRGARLPEAAPKEAQADLDRALSARPARALGVALEELSARWPHASLHAAASDAFLAASDPVAAGRSALLAARLSPGDEQRAERAERRLDLATLGRLRPTLRVSGAAGGLVLALFGVGLALAAARRRRLERYVDGLMGTLRVDLDGEPTPGSPRLSPHHERVNVDLFLTGRLGMARPRAPSPGPTLRLRASHETASRTLRLTPVPDVHASAVRVRIKPETLAQLRQAPGRWRLHAQLGERHIAAADLVVGPV
jgi:hypothetical protein